jgi:proton glutamate symport protein
VKLYTKIAIGLVAGAVAGIALSFAGYGHVGSYLKPFGDAFVNLIKMVVVPLIMASIILGTATLGDLRKLGRIGAKTLGYYMVSTAIAVVFGLFVANLFTPGSNVDPVKREAIMAQVQSDASLARSFTGAAAESQRSRSVGEILLSLIPTNPIRAMADGDMLALITFSILFGVALTVVAPGPRQRVVELLEGINDAMIVLVKMIMQLAPYGVFAIIAAVTAQFGFEFLLSLLNYSLVTIGALAVYYFLYFGITVALIARVNPFTFFRAMRPVGLIAFSTASSNATLPENMEVCRTQLGIPREVVSFALPLGATVNMTGTAIYQGISAMFIAQVFGVDLTIEQQAMVVFTASLASIGAAGVPGIGMVTLAMVLTSVGLPTAGIALVLGVERILDMLRTVLNVTGDAAGALIVGSTEGGLRPVAAEVRPNTATLPS